MIVSSCVICSKKNLNLRINQETSGLLSNSEIKTYLSKFPLHNCGISTNHRERI